MMRRRIGRCRRRSANDNRQSAVCVPKRLLHIFRCRSPCQEKSQVARPFRKRDQFIARLCRNCQFYNAWYCPRFSLSPHFTQPAAVWNRKHHYSRRLLLPGEGGSGIRSAWRRISSSSDMPEAKSRVLEQRPPIARAANSMTHTPFSFTRNSPCTGPSRSPSACAVRSGTGDNFLVGRK